MGDMGSLECDENFVKTHIRCNGALSQEASAKLSLGAPLWGHFEVILGTKWNHRGGFVPGFNFHSKKVPAALGRNG